MKTKYIILALALFIAPAVTAQDYFAKRDLGGGSAMCKQASHCSHLAPSFAKLKYLLSNDSSSMVVLPAMNLSSKASI